MKQVLTLLFAWMPFLFGAGFIAPALAQGLAFVQGTSWLSPGVLLPSIVAGAVWGTYATLRGRWI